MSNKWAGAIDVGKPPRALDVLGLKEGDRILWKGDDGSEYWAVIDSVDDSQFATTGVIAVTAHPETQENPAQPEG